MDKLPVDPATAERFLLGGDEITVLADCAQTDGALFAVQIRMQPGGGPPLLHRHDPGEVYHVLAGEFTFYTGEGSAARRTTARAGEVMPLAGGTPHTVRNESGTEAVAFVVHAPGAPMEQFTRAVVAEAAHGAPSMEAVLTIAARNGIDFLGPVPAHVEGGATPQHDPAPTFSP